MVEQFLETFFSWQHFKDSFPSVFEGFKTNLSLMFVAEACVLVWGMVLALLRVGRGRAFAPLRWLAVVYIDLFRAIPGIVLVYMVGFGISIAQVPWLSGWSQYQLAVVAPTLLYGTYVAEVYPGRDREHPLEPDRRRPVAGALAEQDDALRCPAPGDPPGGPAADERLHRPAEGHRLIGIIGVLDGFRRAQIHAGSTFNLTSFTGLALCYVVITVPMTRFTDRMLKRDQEKLRVGGR
jgi:polar amino acid transport system permease protein